MCLEKLTELDLSGCEHYMPQVGRVQFLDTRGVGLHPIDCPKTDVCIMDRNFVYGSVSMVSFDSLGSCVVLVFGGHLQSFA